MLKWIGDKKGAEGLPDVPARDLSDEEIKKRKLNERELVKTGLYELVTPRKRVKEA